MTSPALRVDTRQQHSLTPRLQHAVRLLQLSSLDFAQEVQSAMGQNPFLELDDGPAGGDTDSATEEHVPAPAELPAEPAHDLQAEQDGWQAAGAGVRHAGASDSDLSALDLVAADVGLRGHLHEQVNVLPLSSRDHQLSAAVIESLDDDGYLRIELNELGALTGLDPEPCEMLTALKRVQSLDPAGVGARSVSECLLLQLPEVEDDTLRSVARRIITKHLDRLANHDVAGLAKLLACPADTVAAACDRIRRFDPRPGWRFGATDVQFVTPDVVVRKVRGAWQASLNPAVIPRVRLNQDYARLFQQHREASHNEMAASLQEARWTVRNVRQRFSTILSVAEAILKRQHSFLEYGPLAMKPLRLKEIADEVGLHESTVSRVTNNKYMATPAGVFELKYFFSRAMATASGSSCSATAIRGVIKDMIDAENPTDPLSDPEIARRLVRQGLTVARRTVTKYRQLMKLAPVERRRRHA